MSQESASHQERRAAPRASERVTVDLVGHDATTLQAESKNLSATGVYCTLERFIPPMTKLRVQFEVPNGKHRVRITCVGVVVRVEPVIRDTQRGVYDTAIYFNDITDRDRATIARFVEQRLSGHAS